MHKGGMVDQCKAGVLQENKSRGRHSEKRRIHSETRGRRSETIGSGVTSTEEVPARRENGLGGVEGVHEVVVLLQSRPRELAQIPYLGNGGGGAYEALGQLGQDEPALG